jgi:hypothetical protein
MLVTLAEAKHHLKIDGNDEDPWLNVFIPAMSDAVMLWLKEPWRAYIPELDSNGDPVMDSNGNPTPDLDSNGKPIPRPVVRAAVLVELADQFEKNSRNVSRAVPEHAGHGYILGAGATSLLNGLRRPTLA